MDRETVEWEFVQQFPERMNRETGEWLNPPSEEELREFDREQKALIEALEEQRRIYERY